MNIQQFLAEHGLLAGSINVNALIGDFIFEMENGLAGRGGSLAMIPTYISADREIPKNESVIVIDAGGTNLRVASVSFDDDHRPHIEDYAAHPMPGSSSEVSADDFFGQLARYLQPVLKKSNKIGFCFSYPVEIGPDMDGRLLKWTKEMKAPEVIGRRIGRGLREALGPAGAGKSIVLLNDTVATLLAGKVTGGKNYGTYVGFILGTGTNTAYLEKNENILKVNHLDPSGSQAVNIESGGFSKAPRGDVDIILDRELEDPGSNRFEKMISGKYLPKITLMTLKKGVEGGLFDESCGSWIRSLKQLDYKHMDDLSNNGGAGLYKTVGLSNADRGSIRDIVKAVIERAAKLAAVDLTAAVVKAAGESSDLSVCINIDGSTYYKNTHLRENTERYLQDMLGARKIRYSLVHTEQAPLIGAAIAGLVSV